MVDGVRTVVIGNYELVVSPGVTPDDIAALRLAEEIAEEAMERRIV
jgi:hypothetical protein